MSLSEPGQQLVFGCITVFCNRGRGGRNQNKTLWEVIDWLLRVRSVSPPGPTRKISDLYRNPHFGEPFHTHHLLILSKDLRWTSSPLRVTVWEEGQRKASGSHPPTRAASAPLASRRRHDACSKSETPPTAQSSGADSVVPALHASPHRPERQAELLPRRGGEKRHARVSRRRGKGAAPGLQLPTPFSLHQQTPTLRPGAPGEPATLQEAGDQHQPQRFFLPSPGQGGFIIATPTSLSPPLSPGQSGRASRASQ